MCLKYNWKIRNKLNRYCAILRYHKSLTFIIFILNSKKLIFIEKIEIKIENVIFISSPECNL